MQWRSPKNASLCGTSSAPSNTFNHVLLRIYPFTLQRLLDQKIRYDCAAKKIFPIKTNGPDMSNDNPANVYTVEPTIRGCSLNWFEYAKLQQPIGNMYLHRKILQNSIASMFLTLNYNNTHACINTVTSVHFATFEKQTPNILYRGAMKLRFAFIDLSNHA